MKTHPPVELHKVSQRRVCSNNSVDLVTYVTESKQLIVHNHMTTRKFPLIAVVLNQLLVYSAEDSIRYDPHGGSLNHNLGVKWLDIDDDINQSGCQCGQH